LKVYTLSEYPLDYAVTQDNLGDVYSALAEVKDKEENLSKAARAYEEALKVYTLGRYPAQFRTTTAAMEKAKKMR
jgi:hypothetical protein